ESRHTYSLHSLFQFSYGIFGGSGSTATNNLSCFQVLVTLPSPSRLSDNTRYTSPALQQAIVPDYKSIGERETKNVCQYAATLCLSLANAQTFRHNGSFFLLRWVTWIARDGQRFPFLPNPTPSSVNSVC